MNGELREFCEEVFRLYTPPNHPDGYKMITDEVFFFIEKDPTLNGNYWRLVKRRGPGTVNRFIGRAIKEHWELTNSNHRQKPPLKSKLIKSHQIFESRAG
jgi:hypothetical protein